MPSSAAVLHVRPSPFFSSRDRLQQHRALSDRRASAPGATLAAEGPSCLFVGPIETASKEMLEALYQQGWNNRNKWRRMWIYYSIHSRNLPSKSKDIQLVEYHSCCRSLLLIFILSLSLCFLNSFQARDSYYSGNPLIIDDMFDKVELKLRLYGSKSVVKYPRCSLRRQSTYADAEEDPSQVFALASVWILLLVFGASAFLVPTIYTISLALKDASDPTDFLYNGRSSFESLTMLNAILFMGLGYLIGYPVASASVQALQGLWRNDLVALKGSCPNCGEEVFAFVRAGKSKQQPHCAECHVCESDLEFRTKVEQSISRPDRRWVYGRVYLVPQTFAKDRRRA